MSRIGRLPIDLPEGVNVAIDNNNVTVTGKLGTLSQVVDRNISVKLENNQIIVSRNSEASDIKAKHGLYRQLISNMVTGVSKGFKKVLVINGVGYKANQSGDKVILNIGFSHPVELVPTPGITLKTLSVTEIEVSGIDKEQVGQYAAKIRDIKRVEPYHAYGIKYSDEVVIRKEGKTSGKK